MPDDPPVPPANGVQCLECPGFGNYYDEVTECPEEPDHAVEPVYLTCDALGRSDDEDNRLPDRSYAYAAPG